jgi:hypothetical protein
MLRLFTLLLFIAGCASSVLAQSESAGVYSKFELFAGYSANGYFANESTVTVVNQNVSSFFNDRAGGPRGFEVSVARNFSGYFGLKLDFSTYFETLNGRTGSVCRAGACTTGQPFNVPLRSSYFLAGPEFKLRNHTRVVPFAHALFGAAYSNATFATTGAVSFSDSSGQAGFASAFGGGLDFRITRSVELRTTLDYAPTFLTEAAPGESGSQRHIRISVGGLFHF